VFAYGPVLLHEALVAAQHCNVRVINMPWLNRLDVAWFKGVAAGRVIVLEDHAPVGGLADFLRRTVRGLEVEVFAVEGYPACGTPVEALAAHRLDAQSLVERFKGS
jgi:transketolase